MTARRAFLKQMRMGIDSLLCLLQTDGDPFSSARSTRLQRKPIHLSILPFIHLCASSTLGLPCCSCVHFTLMPQLNKSLGSGDSRGVTGLNWAEIKCPWIERTNSQHRDFHHPSALIRVYELLKNQQIMVQAHYTLLLIWHPSVFLLK